MWKEKPSFDFIMLLLLFFTLLYHLIFFYLSFIIDFWKQKTIIIFIDIVQHILETFIS